MTVRGKDLPARGTKPLPKTLWIGGRNATLRAFRFTVI